MDYSHGCDTFEFKTTDAPFQNFRCIIYIFAWKQKNIFAFVWKLDQNWPAVRKNICLLAHKKKHLCFPEHLHGQNCPAVRKDISLLGHKKKYFCCINIWPKLTSRVRGNPLPVATSAWACGFWLYEPFLSVLILVPYIVCSCIYFRASIWGTYLTM